MLDSDGLRSRRAPPTPTRVSAPPRWGAGAHRRCDVDVTSTEDAKAGAGLVHAGPGALERAMSAMSATNSNGSDGVVDARPVVLVRYGQHPWPRHRRQHRVTRQDRRLRLTEGSKTDAEAGRLHRALIAFVPLADDASGNGRAKRIQP